MKKREKGFTLVEVLITLALSAIVASSGFVFFNKYRDNQSLKLTTNEIVSALRETKKKSMTQENGKQWGLRFINSTTSISSFVVWSGSGYFSTSTTNKTYQVRRGIDFGNPFDGGFFDVVFSAISGDVSSKRVISLNTGSGDGLINDIIVGSLGRITLRNDKNIVGYWHFDEGTSTIAYDASGDGNNGTLVNSPTWQSGTSCKSGECLSFDTAAQKYILIPSETSLSQKTTLTLNAWIYPTGIGGTDDMGTIILGSGAYYLSFNDSANALSCYWYGTSPAGYHTTPNDSVPLNQWSQITCVWDGANINQYINGVLKNTVAVTGSGNSSGNVIIGAENSTRQFQGQIDEVRIYGRALSAQEVLDMYNDIK